MATQIPALSTIPPFGKRGVQIRDDFVVSQEAAQDHLSGTFETEMEAIKTATNTVTGEIEILAASASASAVIATDKATIAADKEALVSPHYAAIDTVDTNISDINIVATNIAEILQADDNATVAKTKALEAANSASIALNASNYKGDWVAGYNTTGYSLSESVTLIADGKKYISKIDNNLATPVSETNDANWDFLESVSPEELAIVASNSTSNAVAMAIVLG